MKPLRIIAVVTSIAILVVLPSSLVAQGPWQEITMPTVREAAASFPKPPREYGAIHWALGFPPSAERIRTDIEHIEANGASGYMINSGGKQPKYLSPEYMELFKVAVQECKKHGVKMWIEGDDGYPDGFAGGMISRDYPQLGMQGIVADAHYTIAGGQTLSIPLPPDTLGIVAGRHPAAAASAAAPAPAAAAPAPGAKKGAAKGRDDAPPRARTCRCPPTASSSGPRPRRYVGGRFSGQCGRGPLQRRLRPDADDSAAGRDEEHPCQYPRAGLAGRPWPRAKGRRTAEHRTPAACRRAIPMDSAGHGNLGGHLRPPRLPQLAHPLRPAGRRHPRQGQPLLADRLSRSRRPPTTYIKLVLGTVREGCRRRVRQDDPRIPRRRDRLHRLLSLDAQAPGDVQAAKGLRPAAVHRRVFRHADLRRGAARQGRLLGRVERHVPRQFLQARCRTGAGPAAWITWST